MPFQDGTYLALYSDPEKGSRPSPSERSLKGSESFLNFASISDEAMDIFLAPASYVNPLPSLEQAAKLELHPATKWDDELTGYSPRQIVDSWFKMTRSGRSSSILPPCGGLITPRRPDLVPLMINRGWHFRLSHMGSHHVGPPDGKVYLRDRQQGNKRLRDQRRSPSRTMKPKEWKFTTARSSGPANSFAAH